MIPCANEVVAAVRTARAAMRKRGIVVLREIWMCRTAGNCLDPRCDQRERPSAAPRVRQDLYRRDATIRLLQPLQSAQFSIGVLLSAFFRGGRGRGCGRRGDDAGLGLLL